MEDALAEELAPGSSCVLGQADMTWDGLVELVAGPRLATLSRIHSEYARIGARRGAAPAVRALGPVDILPRLGWEPADVELVLGLARAAPVRVRLPWAPGKPEIYGGIEPILSAFEKRGAE